MQEDVADELAEEIFRLVSSLPKSVHQVEEEPMPDHIQKMFNEATNEDDHHHQHHHSHGAHSYHHGHSHAHMGGAGGYMDAYGLGNGWAA